MGTWSLCTHVPVKNEAPTTGPLRKGFDKSGFSHATLTFDEDEPAMTTLTL